MDCIGNTEHASQYTLIKKCSILKYLEEAASVTQFIVHVGVHGCVNHIRIWRELWNI